MRTPTKLFGAVAVASLVGLGAGALTGTGLSTSGTAAAPQFIGGTVTQSVTGATLTDITYGFTDTTDTAANLITLTFATGADGKTVAVTPSGAVGGGTFTCSAVATNSSSCTYSAGTDTLSGYTGLTSLAVTVS